VAEVLLLNEDYERAVNARHDVQDSRTPRDGIAGTPQMRPREARGLKRISAPNTLRICPHTSYYACNIKEQVILVFIFVLSYHEG
jgi:hypothetical protein